VTDFETVHGRLREILMRQRGDLAITKDELLAELEASGSSSSRSGGSAGG
jgi:hypothetical protein